MYTGLGQCDQGAYSWDPSLERGTKRHVSHYGQVMPNFVGITAVALTENCRDTLDSQKRHAFGLFLIVLIVIDCTLSFFLIEILLDQTCK